ncbi:MAG: glycerophosphotransferase [Lachnospiraceae bacterium]|nr:glycerophosphotransferase [Lachnospiraceae bacterium]
MIKKSKIKEWGIAGLFYLFRIVPIKQNKIVFCNYLGKGYGCNPKYIAEEIIKQKKDWELVWLTENMNASFPKEIKKVRYESVRSIFELATAGVWIDNQRKLYYNRKRRKQYFIETWHGGGGPMKKIGADNPRNFGNKPYERTSKHMDRIVDLMISNSTCCSKIYRSAFLYTGEILECGYPRNDILAGEWYGYKEKVYAFFGLPMETKTVLYAPTYRNGRKLDQYQLDLVMLREELHKRFGGEWVVLMRLHPTMAKKADYVTYSSEVRNASVYDDTQELLAGCDILISDYSSVISEFALTKKPVFLYATDVKEYAVERDFYIDYYTLPFPIAENNQQLKHNIETFQDLEYKEKVEDYLRLVGMKDQGRAANTIVQRIEGWMNV